MFTGDIGRVYMSLLKMSPDAIIVSTPEEKVIFANEKAAEMFGFEDFQQMNGIDAFSLLAEHDRERAMANMQTLIEGIQKDRHNEYTLQRKDGTEFPGTITNSSIDDELSHKPILFITIIRKMKHLLCPQCGYECKK